MQYFIRFFFNLKVTQSFLYFCINRLYIFLSQRYIFLSSTHWVFISSSGFCCLPSENLLLDLTLVNFWKFNIFPSVFSVSRATNTDSYASVKSRNYFHSEINQTMKDSFLTIIKAVVNVPILKYLDTTF